jgi:hypothetical protein
MAVSQAAKQRLIDYFLTNPAWVSAARPLGEGVCSALRFQGEPEPWRLIRRNGQSVLEPGEPDAPDLFFEFSEGSIAYLTELENASIGDFATRLYECAFLFDEDRRIEVQVVGPISQIIRRGYWKIVLKGGLQVLRIARAHNIGSVEDLRRLFGMLQGKNSAEVREAIRAARGMPA